MTTLPLSRVQKRLLVALGLALSLFTMRAVSDASETSGSDDVDTVLFEMPAPPAPPVPPAPPAPPTFRS